MQEETTNYEVYMLKINSKNDWELWDTYDEEPTEDCLEEEMALSYCVEHYEGMKVLRVERTNIFQA